MLIAPFCSLTFVIGMIGRVTQWTVISGRKSGTQHKKAGVEGGLSYFSSQPDTLKSSLNVSRRVTKHRIVASTFLLIISHYSSGRKEDPGSPKVKKTLRQNPAPCFVKPLTAEKPVTVSAIEKQPKPPPPINSTHVRTK